MKKALITASMASMLDNFNRNNIKLLQELGYEVTLAANFDGGEDSSPPERLRRFKKEMEEAGCTAVHIDFSRKLSDPRRQVRSYRQLRKLAGEDFQLVHCNSPICAAMTRLAFRKKRRTDGTRVIYTAHGFHFFAGAPLKNWLVYFPVEWACAHWTDILNTINREDYRMARKHLRAKRVAYIPGAGIDMDKFRPGSTDRQEVRKSLGIAEDAKVLLSVGELSRRKNQAAVIRAFRQLDVPGLIYAICGRGEAEAELKRLAKDLGLEDKVLFLGYREDIPRLCRAADLFVFPSLQEGMPMALMEAVAMKVPVVCSDIRGNRELVGEKELLFDPVSDDSIADCIRRALDSDLSGTAEAHYRKAFRYRMEEVARRMREEYLSAAGGTDAAPEPTGAAGG